MIIFVRKQPIMHKVQANVFLLRKQPIIIFCSMMIMNREKKEQTLQG